MSRYICNKGKKVTIKKANDYCILQNCPELFVNRPVFENNGSRLKHITVPVVLESCIDIEAIGRCKGE